MVGGKGIPLRLLTSFDSSKFVDQGVDEEAGSSDDFSVDAFIC